MIVRNELLRQTERITYVSLDRTKREALWVGITAEGLNIPPEDAERRIRENNRLPLFSRRRMAIMRTTEVFPRLAANAALLAQVSPDSEGPRGGRPSLASTDNIFHISGLSTVTDNIPYVKGRIAARDRNYGKTFRWVTGGALNFLVDLGLTASNPTSAPEGVTFSAEDVKNGIYIPKEIDAQAARAIGIAYGCGHVNSSANLNLTSSRRNKPFFEESIPQIFEEAFNFAPGRQTTTATIENAMKPGGYDYVRFSCGSKAVGTYLANHLGFPTTREARRKAGLPRAIMDAEKEIQDEFLKYFLASTVAFDDKGAGMVRVSDVSEPILTDIAELIKARATKHSITIRKGVMSNNYLLTVNTIPAMELYEGEFLNENPRVKSEVEAYRQRGLGRKTRAYLRRIHDSVDETTSNIDEVLSPEPIQGDVSLPIAKKMKLLDRVEGPDYWKFSETQRMAIWANILAHGLGITPEEAYRRIRRNNASPIEEVEKVWTRDSFIDGSRSFVPESTPKVVYPRFNANAVLLAQASPGFEGPRGRRPSLASASNILRISGVTEKQLCDYGVKFNKTSRGIGKFLRELNLTGANPNGAPKGVEFSADDIRNGIYIPKEVDVATARAIGIVYGDGVLRTDNSGNILLHSPARNRGFYEESVRQAFEVAFNFSSDREVRTHHKGAKGKFGAYDFVRLTYGSKAVGGYFINHLGFPTSVEVRRETGLPTQIMKADKQVQDEFLRYFLAATVAFDDTGAGGIAISDVSKSLLKDVDTLIRARVTKPPASLRIRHRAHGDNDNYMLSFSTIPSMELYVQGFFNANPRLKAEAGTFWNNRLGFRALKYLKERYDISDTINLLLA
jgi:hypothetical protein